MKDPFTGVSKLDDLTGLPDRISTSRLLRFEVPESGFGEEGADELDLGALMAGQIVAWLASDGVRLLRVTNVASGEWVDGVHLETQEE